MTRVYVPTDAAGLRGLAEQSVLGPGPLAAFAVTPALRAEIGSSDDEELEWAATRAAAAASRGLVGEGGSRLFVVAADVDAVEPATTAPGAVVVRTGVPLSAVAAIHVGDDPDDPDDLAWYATQELRDLL